MDMKIFLDNPELAKNVRFEISGENLLELASVLAKSTVVVEKEEEYLTRNQVKEMTGRKDSSTLWRWHNQGILRHNQLGMYKKFDVVKFLNKQ